MWNQNAEELSCTENVVNKAVIYPIVTSQSLWARLIGVKGKKP